MNCPYQHTRRDWLKQATAAAGACLLTSPMARGAAPAAPVAVARCKTYQPAEMIATLGKMFDQIGGLGRLVKGKTVAIKINLTGAPTYRLGYELAEDTHYTHPGAIAATAYLMAKAGARRIRILESPWATSEPVEEYLIQANIEPRDIIGAAPVVEFENTNYLGKAKKYSRFTVPYGGLIYPGFDLNHSYADCDVFVSLAKAKEHATAGITLAMKNCFGNAPATIYGSGASADEPSPEPHGGRQMFHTGYRQPPKSAPQEKTPLVSRDDKVRVPRVVVDMNAARPVDLAIVEAVATMTGGEGPWVGERQTRVDPGLLAVGTNAVCTDAVCLALLGFDPAADRGTPPYEDCDSTLRHAEDVGLGTRDMKRIEVLGPSISSLRFDLAKIRADRRAARGGRGGRGGRG